VIRRIGRRSGSGPEQHVRILVFDYSGHPFQAQLARLLADRGHAVVHGHCAAYESGKGRLVASPGDPVRYTAVGEGHQINKYRFVHRFFQELRLGMELAALIGRERPNVILISNTPVPALLVAVAAIWALRTPWVLWHQDVNSAAVASLAAQHCTLFLRTAARLLESGERWCARRASRIVVVAEAFLAVHSNWGTRHKTTVIPNWAPLDEIVPRGRHNEWSHEHGLDEAVTLLYCGTLGMKHNPLLLVSLAARVRALGCPATLVVVNEGPAGAVLDAQARSQGIPLVLAPFQPYARLPDVLGSANVLVVLLEPDASEFSIPSKAHSYLCAGRPVLGLMPTSNAAAGLIARAGNLVLPPHEDSIAEAARWVVNVSADPERAQAIGHASRTLAESEFSAESIAARFEAVLLEAHVGLPVRFNVDANNARSVR